MDEGVGVSADVSGDGEGMLGRTSQRDERGFSAEEDGAAKSDVPEGMDIAQSTANRVSLANDFVFQEQIYVNITK